MKVCKTLKRSSLNKLFAICDETYRRLGITANVQPYKNFRASMKKRAQNWQKGMFSCQMKSTDDRAFWYDFMEDKVTTHNTQTHISNLHLEVAATPLSILANTIQQEAHKRRWLGYIKVHGHSRLKGFMESGNPATTPCSY